LLQVCNAKVSAFNNDGVSENVCLTFVETALWFIKTSKNTEGQRQPYFELSLTRKSLQDERTIEKV